MCPKHSDAKQTEMMGFSAEKGLLQGHARRWVAQALKSLKLPEAKHFYRQGVGKGVVIGSVMGLCMIL